jgi:2-(3-amino-3-carboxypropyl)histidine synthase
MEYNLELDKVVKEIKKSKIKKVCLQLPDGLKPKAEQIVKQIEDNTNAKVFVWLGSCYGACDVPLEIEKLGIQLLVQWGHSKWKYEWLS